MTETAFTAIAPFVELSGDALAAQSADAEKAFDTFVTDLEKGTIRTAAKS